MKKMITIYADDGKILTDGKIYGTTISLAEGADESDFYEITLEEYEKILEAEENLTTSDLAELDVAIEAQYANELNGEEL